MESLEGQRPHHTPREPVPDVLDDLHRVSVKDTGPAMLPSNMHTLVQLFAARVAATPQTEAYRHFDTAAGAWISTTWAQAGERVAQWSEALRALGLPRGARVAILLPNGLDAVCIDLAALTLALVPVPMHALDNPQSIAYILGDSDASLLVAASDTQWRAIASVGTAWPALRQVVVVRKEVVGLPASGAVPVVGLTQWLSLRQPAPVEGIGAPEPPSETDLAALVYTSGTMGKPKGVMLTHSNVMSNVAAALGRVAPLQGDIFLSFLPLSHTFERTAGYYLPIAAGACVAYARSVAQLGEDLRSVRPTVLISVPRIYERVYATLQETLAGSATKRRLFSWAEAVGWRRFCRRQGLAVEGTASPALDALAWPLLDLLVGRRMRASFGGRLRIAVSGGAALALPIARCFLGLGLPVLQGYGMTETSPVVAVNAPEDNDPSTVGRALAGVELRTAENRELLVRGPNVMRGYWKRDDDTALAFVDGWRRTGDQAAIEDGRIRILGRLKEIIVTSTGEKTAPADLERAITADPLFEQAYVFGDNRPFIACMVVLAPASWARLASNLGLDPRAPASLEASAARAAVLKKIASLTREFPYYARPRAVSITLEPWTIENSLMTPTLKLKRNSLAARYASEIDALYRR
jgi:long-chain acyl-CoA synthetase